MLPTRLRRLLSRGLGAAGLGLVALLALGAGATRWLAWRAEERFPPLGETVDVDGWRQHYLVRGSGPPVVFVHGAYGTLEDFVATVLEPASARYRCIAWDRPGHGYSERPPGEVGPGVQAEILLDLVRVLELERPLLVGFSYGGAVCLAAGLAAPDELRGILLLNSPSHPWPDPLDAEYRIASLPLLGWLVSETAVAPLAPWLGRQGIERAFAPLAVPPIFSRSPTALALRPASYRANTQDIRLLKPFLARQSARYHDLALPVTALVSEGDEVVRPTIHIPRLARQAPRCRQVHLPAAGHQVLYTHPELVLELLDEALGE